MLRPMTSERTSPDGFDHDIGRRRFLLGAALLGGAAGVGLTRADAADAAADATTGTFSLRDYGAVGNDTANDAPALQAALNAVADAGGGVLFVPPGV